MRAAGGPDLLEPRLKGGGGGEVARFSFYMLLIGRDELKVLIGRLGRYQARGGEPETVSKVLNDVRCHQSEQALSV